MRPSADKTVKASTNPSSLSPALIAVGVTGVLAVVLFSTKGLAAAVTSLPTVSDVPRASATEGGEGLGLVPEVLRLIGATLIGLLVTFVQRHTVAPQDLIPRGRT